MARVYITAPLPARATEILDKAQLAYEAFAGPGLIDKQTLLDHVGDCEVLITPLSTQVDEEVLAAAPAPTTSPPPPPASAGSRLPTPPSSPRFRRPKWPAG